MNTNINNKKFKLVSLRNQPMQAFSCKRECDKEASGDGRGREKKGAGGGEGHREVGDRGRTWREAQGERLRRGDKKKLWRPLVWFVLVLTTLKNRWTLYLIVVIVNPHVFGFPFVPWLLLFTFILPVFHDSGMPPQSQKKKCHTTDSSLMIYTYVYTHIYTLVNALNQKCFLCSFPFLCLSRRSTPGEWDENRKTSERMCVREREKRSRRSEEKYEIL